MVIPPTINITIFAQRISILPRNLFQREVAQHKSDFASKGLDVWTHLTAIRILPIAKGFNTHSEKAPSQAKKPSSKALKGRHPLAKGAALRYAGTYNPANNRDPHSTNAPNSGTG
ncbi:MAG: DUF4372 domain-containing protein [Bacteroidetes bacterium]|nr:DUF4372 domain-containing protein [Bacteroidota bacterium]